MKIRLALFIGVTCLLAGCTSPQVRYHTLVGSAAGSQAVAPAGFSIDLLPVGVPAQLDTWQIVIRQDDSRAVVLDNDRWLSPLGDELQTALSLSISRQFNTVDVAGLARDTRTPAVRILLQVRRFDTRPGQNVTLDADWSLSIQGGGRNERLVCKSHLTHTLSRDPMQMSPVWQTVVDRLARQIGQTAADEVEKGTAACRRD